MRAAAVIGTASLFFVGAMVLLCFTSPGFLNGGHGFMEVSFLRSGTTHRKLLFRVDFGLGTEKLRRKQKLVAHLGEENVEEPNRIWGEKCSRSDIVIDQGPTAPLPSGIPTYTVEIMNVCGTGCNISRIHLNCGWFSSATLVNPRVFKRLRFNDCLVNDGKPLVNGGSISFEYANTFLYSLKVSSVVCY
ncbi:hypothetical protein ACLB2K_046752 [Fragaria x ananassa]